MPAQIGMLRRTLSILVDTRRESNRSSAKRMRVGARRATSLEKCAPTKRWGEVSPPAAPRDPARSAKDLPKARIRAMTRKAPRSRISRQRYGCGDRFTDDRAEESEGTQPELA